VVSSADNVARSVVVLRVARVWPALTVSPTETSILATVPDTANVGFASRVGATLPEVVTDVLTVPCCTVDVSCVLAAEELLGATRRNMPAPKTMTMVAKATVIHTRRLIFMT
jgi:hypothetical protein